MNEKNTEMTFELSDLSYAELIDTYVEINDFIDYLSKLEHEINLSINEGEKKS